jgi:hypothetical protein
MSLADIKAQSRQALHDFMSRPASFYDQFGTLAIGNATARHHAAPKMLGDLAGTNLSYAEMHERPATLVIWNNTIALADLERGAKLIFNDSEGYLVESVMPADGPTTTVEIVEMKASEIVGLTLPDGTVAP